MFGVVSLPLFVRILRCVKVGGASYGLMTQGGQKLLCTRITVKEYYVDSGKLILVLLYFPQTVYRIFLSALKGGQQICQFCIRKPSPPHFTGLPPPPLYIRMQMLWEGGGQVSAGPGPLLGYPPRWLNTPRGHQKRCWMEPARPHGAAPPDGPATHEGGWEPVDGKRKRKMLSRERPLRQPDPPLLSPPFKLPPPPAS